MAVGADADWLQLAVYLHLEETINFRERSWVHQESLQYVRTRVSPKYCALGLHQSNSFQTRGHADKQAKVLHGYKADICDVQHLV